ncbi:MAG: lytic murein transglycosylase [Alphaproteobacteria bacterium]|nr:lytic murein transglycosylase [Alphaproteobacteria bacterium]
MISASLRKSFFVFSIVTLFFNTVYYATSQTINSDFETWRNQFYQKASAHGISDKTFNLALGQIKPDPSILEQDTNQPEFVKTFNNYLDQMVTHNRITQGLHYKNQYSALLNKISEVYQVPSQYLIALWGLESNFGSNTGKLSIVRSLATLAYSSTRKDFFENQLLDALTLIEQNIIPLNKMYGSWAGALGQVQFMPHDYLTLAVDFDGDGKRDLFTSVADALASAANYLKNAGWNNSFPWGVQITVPNNFPWHLAEPSKTMPLSFWLSQGIKFMDPKHTVPDPTTPVSIALPMGHKGPIFLLYPNYQILLKWNRSINYALAAGILSDYIAGKQGIINTNVDDQPMTTAEIIEIQNLFNTMGYNLGTPDGRVGPATRDAIRNFQYNKQIPADGYPTPSLLELMRKETRKL